MKPLNRGVDCYHTMFNTHTHTHQRQRRVSIFGGGGGSCGQKDNYIHTHTRLHNMGYAIKKMEMYQSSELFDHFVI